jgi:GNAT superfamily N-acetyltransferase
MLICTDSDHHSMLTEQLFANTYHLLNKDYSGYSYLDPSLITKSYNFNLASLLARKDTKVCYVSNAEGYIDGFVILKPQQFDSIMLGLSVYQITDFGFLETSSKLEETCALLLQGLKQMVQETGIEYLYYSSDTNHPLSSWLLNLLFRENFYYLGTLLKFSVTKKNQVNFRSDAPIAPNRGLTIRDAVQEDRDAIARLARESYKFDRFHLDPNLPTALCDRLFEQSTINSLTEGLADILYIAEIDGDVAGYLSARRKLDATFGFYVGEGMISAVDPSYRSLGIFTKLSNKMWDWFLLNTEFGESGTYLNNLAVHKSWTNNRLPVVRGHHQLAYFCKNG